jgi:hypothetical protein
MRNFRPNVVDLEKKKFAWMPTKLSNGKKVWFTFYWAVWKKVESTPHSNFGMYDLVNISYDEYIAYKLTKNW